MTLGHRQLYILPTRYGVLFALLVLVLLIASINYGNGLAYGLTFLLASMAVVSMLHTHRNLLRLRVAEGAAAAVFAGETAEFEVRLTNSGAATRYGIVIEQEAEASGGLPPWRLRGRREIGRVDIAPGETACVTLAAPARRRGMLTAPAFSLSTRFPLGLLYAWSRRIELPVRCLVYPRPAPPTPLRAGTAQGERPETAGRGGGDDFAGLREYRLGDSLRHVHWKAVAREQGWYTKEFGGGAPTTLWFDWDALEGFDTEARLSVLTRWVVDAQRAGDLYGLKLPGTSIAPSSGELHEANCLGALALFG